MPPNHHFPPSLEESFAAINDKLAQFVAATIANNNRLATILDIISANIANLPPILPLSPPSSPSLTTPHATVSPKAYHIALISPPPSSPMPPPPPPLDPQPMSPTTLSLPSPPPSPLPPKPLLQQHLPSSPKPPPPKITFGEVRPLTLTFQPFNKHFTALVCLCTSLPDLEDKVHLKDGGIDTCLGLNTRPPPWPDPTNTMELHGQASCDTFLIVAINHRGIPTPRGCQTSHV